MTKVDNPQPADEPKPAVSDTVSMLAGLLLTPRRIQRVISDFDRDRKRANTVEAVRKLYDDARKANADNFIELHNVSLYVLLFDEDLSAYRQDFLLANTQRRHRFVARHLASLLYEGSQDIPVLLGHDYRDALSAVEFSAGWEPRLNSIRASFNSFKAAHESELKDIRHFVGAHKDNDAATQLAILDKLEPMTIYKAAAKFTEPLTALLAFQTDVTAHLGKPRVMLKEVAKGLGSR